jgi:hypothetical protein
MERQYTVILRTPEELVSIGSFGKREDAVEFGKQQVAGRGILIGIARVTNAEPYMVQSALTHRVSHRPVTRPCRPSSPPRPD